MADNPKKVIRLGGPWKGLNELPGEATPNQCEDCWNVDFDGEFATTRGGRELIGTAASAAVAKCIKYSYVTVGEGGVNSYEDVTNKLDKGSSTWATLGDGVLFLAFGIGVTGYHAIYVGFPFKFSSVTIGVASANTAAATMSGTYFNGTTWASLAAFTDGTVTGGKSLSKNGSVTFTEPIDWVPTAVNGSDNYYFVKLQFGGSEAPNNEITYINGTLKQNTSGVSNPNGSLPINGMYHWQRPNGERLTILGMDLIADGQARLVEYNRINGVTRPFSIRGLDGNVTSGPGAKWKFLAIGKALVACNGYCFLHSTDEDPRVMVPFEQITVREAADLKPFVPTDVQHMAFHNGRLFIVNRTQPNYLFFSQTIDGPSKNDITGYAPLGGAGIFDPDFYFYVSDPSGGPITGLSQFADKLIVFTPRSTKQAYVSDNVDASSLITLDANIGCVAPESIQSTNQGVFFLGAGSVYVNSGGQNQEIGRRVSKTIGKLNTMSLVGACSTVYMKKYQYRLYVPGGTTFKNDTVLVYNFRNDTWTKYGLPRWLNTTAGSTKYYTSMAASLRDAEWDEEILEATYDGAIYRSDSGNFDNTAPIFWQIVTSRMKFEDGSIIRVGQARVFLESSGNTNVMVGFIRDSMAKVSRDGSSRVYLGESGLPANQYDDPNELDYDTLYTVSGSTDGLAIGVDTWVEKRIRPCNVTFGRDAYYAQFALNAGDHSATIPSKAKVGAIEVEAVPLPGRR